MAFSFNGTTVSFPGTITTARVVSITDNKGTGKIDITGSETVEHQYEATLNDVEVTFEVILGALALVRGATGATTVTWNDGSPDTSIDLSVVTGFSRTGSIDGAIVTSVTIVPAET